MTEGREVGNDQHHAVDGLSPHRIGEIRNLGILFSLIVLSTIWLIPIQTKPIFTLPFLVIFLFIGDQIIFYLRSRKNLRSSEEERSLPKRSQILFSVIFVVSWIFAYAYELRVAESAFSGMSWIIFSLLVLSFVVATSILMAPPSRDWFEKSIKFVIFMAANYVLISIYENHNAHAILSGFAGSFGRRHGLYLGADSDLVITLAVLFGASCLLYIAQNIYRRFTADKETAGLLPEVRPIAVFGLLFLGSAWFVFFLVQYGRPDSAALYVGLPTIIAVALSLTPRPRTATGSVLKTLTIGMIMAGLLLGPGVVCVVILAPIFYMFGIIGAVSIDAARMAETARERRAARLRCSVVLLAALASALEGTHPALTFNTHEVVRIEREYRTSPEAFEAALDGPTTLGGDVPMVLRLGFPYPVRAFGSGTDIGDRRGVHLEDRNIYFNIIGPSHAMSGDAVFEITRRTENSIRFSMIEDHSAVSKWLRWRHSDLHWTWLDDGRVSVVLEIHFDRRLDPAWYFAPLQRAVVGAAAPLVLESLIDERLL